MSSTKAFAPAERSSASPMPDAILVAHDLWKSYNGKADVLRGAELEVVSGEAALVWGPNGSGKTTLLSVLGGLDAPTRGTVLLGGREISRLKEAQLARIRLHDVGFVFQTHNLIDDLTVAENLALPLRLAREPAEARVAELLEAFGLTALAARRPRQISVGESQRVAVARALANGPKVLLADEPTAALDAKGTATVLEALERARSAFDAALVVATHDADVRALRATSYLLETGLLKREG